VLLIAFRDQLREFAKLHFELHQYQWHAISGIGRSRLCLSSRSLSFFFFFFFFSNLTPHSTTGCPCYIIGNYALCDSVACVRGFCGPPAFTGTTTTTSPTTTSTTTTTTTTTTTPPITTFNTAPITTTPTTRTTTSTTTSTTTTSTTSATSADNNGIVCQYSESTCLRVN
jgi:hypothetical protein